MDEFNRALGVECAFCHVPDRWTDETRPAFGVARSKTRMVQVINEQLDDIGVVSRWTCHGGHVRPSRVPRTSIEAELAHWPAGLGGAAESRKMAMAVYNASLGVTCEHCHSPDWKSMEKKPMALMKVMSGMFDEFPKYMPPTARTQCFMCHKGLKKPQARSPMQ